MERFCRAGRSVRAGAGHHVQHQCDHAIDAKPCGVDADGVVGRSQWRHRATGVAGIAGENLAQQTVKCDGNPFVFQLLIASLGALVGTRGQEHLVAGVGEDHRPHVATVGHQPRQLPERPLAILERGPHFRDRRDRRCRRAGGFGAQFVRCVVTVDEYPQVAGIALAEADQGSRSAQPAATPTAR